MLKDPRYWILVIQVVLGWLTMACLPVWPYSSDWGMGPALFFLILLVLAFAKAEDMQPPGAA